MNTLNKLQIIVLCGFLLTVTACSSLSKNGENTPSSSSTTTAPIFTASNDPRADVVKALRRNLEAKSYRMRITGTTSDGGNSTITTEIMMPDRMHTITEMDTPGESPVKREKIHIGEESYVRAGDTPWKKVELGIGSMMSQWRDPKVVDEIAKTADAKYLGTDTLNGAPMLIYQYTTKSLLNPGKDVVNKIWIGATDNLPYQSDSEFDYPDPLNTGKMMHSKSTMTFYDYNTDIKIEPPIK